MRIKNKNLMDSPFRYVLVQTNQRTLVAIGRSQMITMQRLYFHKDATNQISYQSTKSPSAVDCGVAGNTNRIHWFSSASSSNSSSKKKKVPSNPAKKNLLGKGSTKNKQQRIKNRNKNVLSKSVLNEYKKQIERMNQQSAIPDGEEGTPSSSPRVPPAFLAATASPNVWIASCFAKEHEIDRNELYALTPLLTTNSSKDDNNYGGWKIPNIFKKGIFDYVTPASFGHELPAYSLPEVAFLGRSNVGKSSLINALTRRKHLALISKTPGRTQQVNYFALYRDRHSYLSESKNNTTNIGTTAEKSSFHPSDALGFFVDLPGYGYAEAPDVKVKEWQERTINFLSDRQQCGAMTRVHLLVDSRHGMSDMDRAVMSWLDDVSLPYTLIFTKADLTNRIHLIRYINDACMRYHSQMYGSTMGTQSPLIHVTSSKTNVGIPELLWSIDADFSNYFYHVGTEGLSNDNNNPYDTDEESQQENKPTVLY